MMGEPVSREEFDALVAFIRNRMLGHFTDQTKQIELDAALKLARKMRDAPND